MAKFTVVEMRGNHCIVESGNTQGKIVLDEDREWQFKHMLWDKNLKVKVALTDAKPTPSLMNPHIGTRKTYK
jgi:hypothetical protein